MLELHSSTLKNMYNEELYNYIINNSINLLQYEN